MPDFFLEEEKGWQSIIIKFQSSIFLNESVFYLQITT